MSRLNHYSHIHRHIILVGLCECLKWASISALSTTFVVSSAPWSTLGDYTKQAAFHHSLFTTQLEWSLKRGVALDYTELEPWSIGASEYYSLWPCTIASQLRAWDFLIIGISIIYKILYIPLYALSFFFNLSVYLGYCHWYRQRNYTYPESKNLI